MTVHRHSIFSDKYSHTYDPRTKHSPTPGARLTVNTDEHRNLMTHPMVLPGTWILQCHEVWSAVRSGA